VNPKHITPEAEFDSNAGQPNVLFEADGYKVIAVVFKGHPGSRLAQRCDGYRETIRGCPIGWHVVPEFLEIPLLHALLDEALRNPGRQSASNPVNFIFDELKRRNATPKAWRRTQKAKYKPCSVLVEFPANPECSTGLTLNRS
jgi:hypothetical protein